MLPSNIPVTATLDALSDAILNSFALEVGFVAVAVIVVELPALSLNVIVAPGEMLAESVTVIVKEAKD